MSELLELEPEEGAQVLWIRHPALPDDRFACIVPELIGPTDRMVSGMTPEWSTENGELRYHFEVSSDLEYWVRVIPASDGLTISLRLRNLGAGEWDNSHSFTCFSPYHAPTFSDFEGTRTFLFFEGNWTPIVSLPRVDSPRPTAQFWYTQEEHTVPIIEQFQATSSIVPAPVLAVRSQEGNGLIAISASSPLYLMNNLEYSCIHCCPGFGSLAPGEIAEASHRIFIDPALTLSGLREKLSF